MIALPRPADERFAAETAAARRILVVEVAGLGDLVHSLPAMWAIRHAWPSSELHCMVREEYASLLPFVPWIDRVWPYRRGGVRDLRSAAGMALRLRRERFDIAFDLMGSDHASIAAWASGARRRLIRRPGRIKPRFAWRLAATDLVEHPFGPQQMWRQRLGALCCAGVSAPESPFAFVPQNDAAFERTLDGEGPIVHLSPYTRRGWKELPEAQLVQLLERLRTAVPEVRLAITCSRSERERAQLEGLLHALPFPPWRAYAGSLDLPRLYALIARASLHLSGDTGSMHLARLAGTPSVTWMSALASYRTWAPEGRQHEIVCSTARPGSFLPGVSTEAIVEKSVERLRESNAELRAA